MVAETVKSDEDRRRRQEPPASMQTRMAMQQLTTTSTLETTSTSNNNNDNNSKESISNSVTRDEQKKQDTPINARPGVTKESAFENMQAMLRSSTEEEEEEEDIFDPFAGIVASASDESSQNTASAIGEIVTDIAYAKKQVDEKATTVSSSESFDQKIASGLQSLREGRKLARAAEDESAKPTVSLENLMSAEECFANAVNDFVVAVEVEPSAVSAKGNLGNALLARGIALRALRDATAERVFGSSRGAFGGLSEEDVRFYGETAEDALVDAGRYFRAVAVEDRDAALASDEKEQSSSSSSSSVAVIVALVAWGRALSQRGALVRDDAEVFNLYDSGDEEDESVIASNLTDASKLFLAAAEKHRAAIERCALADKEGEKDEDSKISSNNKTLVQSRRIEAYCRWGEALESAAECEFMLRSGKERELWTAASGAYGESERLGEDSGAATAGVERCEAKLGEDEYY